MDQQSIPIQGQCDLEYTVNMAQLLIWIQN